MSAVCAGSLTEVLVDLDAYGFPCVEYRPVEELRPGDKVRGVNNSFVRVANVRCIHRGGGVVPLYRYLGLLADGSQHVFLRGKWRLLRNFVAPHWQKCRDIMRVELEGPMVGMVVIDAIACATPPETSVPIATQEEYDDDNKETQQTQQTPSTRAVRLWLKGVRTPGRAHS